MSKKRKRKPQLQFIGVRVPAEFKKWITKVAKKEKTTVSKYAFGLIKGFKPEETEQKGAQ